MQIEKIEINEGNSRKFIKGTILLNMPQPFIENTK